MRDSHMRDGATPTRDNKGCDNACKLYLHTHQCSEIVYTCLSLRLSLSLTCSQTNTYTLTHTLSLSSFFLFVCVVRMCLCVCVLWIVFQNLPCMVLNDLLHGTCEQSISIPCTTMRSYAYLYIYVYSFITYMHMYVLCVCVMSYLI